MKPTTVSGENLAEKVSGSHWKEASDNGVS